MKTSGRKKGTDVVVVLGNGVRQAHLDCAYDGDDERAELQVSELHETTQRRDQLSAYENDIECSTRAQREGWQTHLLANAPMPSRPKRLIRTLRPLTHSSEPIINLLPILIRIQLKSLLRLSVLIVPPTRFPRLRIVPQARVHLADDRRGEDVVALGDDVGGVL